MKILELRKILYEISSSKAHCVILHSSAQLLKQVISQSESQWYRLKEKEKESLKEKAPDWESEIKK